MLYGAASSEAQGVKAPHRLGINNFRRLPDELVEEHVSVAALAFDHLEGRCLAIHPLPLAPYGKQGTVASEREGQL